MNEPAFWTDAIIQQGRSPSGTWNRRQAEVLGVAWPLQKGWKKQVLRRRTTTDEIELFLSLAGSHKSNHPGELLLDSEYQSIIGPQK